VRHHIGEPNTGKNQHTHESRGGDVHRHAMPILVVTFRAFIFCEVRDGGVVRISMIDVRVLPAGLIAGSVLAADHVPAQVTDAALIGVDLGPNLSIAGSLATTLWLVTLRRGRLDVTTATFLRLGLLVMPPALVLSIACMILFSPAP
jgi:hypothetical protein